MNITDKLIKELDDENKELHRQVADLERALNQNNQPVPAINLDLPDNLHKQAE